MTKTIGLVMVLAMTAACEDPPSCQQAITHLYREAGCMFIDTSTGQTTSELEAIDSCQQINAAVPDQCRGEFEDWLDCLYSRPSNSTMDQCASCTQESDALFACG